MTDHSGKKFNFWTIIRYHGLRSGQYVWLCRCECGNEKLVQVNHVIYGKSKSCGCGVNLIGREIHNLTGTYVAMIHGNIKQRCLNPNSTPYVNYGGRGIKVCEYVLSSPASLLALVGERPSSTHSLDRIDNEGHYSCGLCAECQRNNWSLNLRWATKSEQMSNRRCNVRVTIKGITKTLTEWARSMGVHPNTLRHHISRGKVEATMVAAR